LSLTAQGTVPGVISPPVNAGYSGTLEGLGNTISNLTIVNPSGSGHNGAFITILNPGATVRDLGFVGASVASSFGYAGLVVGENFGTIAQVYANGAVTTNSYVGILAGANFASGVIVNSYATGSVSSNGGYAGGLAGTNDGIITQSYSGAAVATTGFGGGLVGTDAGTISNSFATGSVSASFGKGGLFGVGSTATVINSYWDTQTTGRSNSDRDSLVSTATYGLTTAQFQSGFAANLGSAFGGGSNGLYPFLNNFFPNGVQAVSGTAYSNAGVTPSASSAAGAVTVGALINGTSIDSATTGANGYYYIFTPAGTIPGGTNQVVITSSGATGGTRFQQANTGTLSGLDIWGTYLWQQADSSTSTLSGLSAALTGALGGTTLPSYANQRIDAAANFVIDQPVSLPGGTLILNNSGGGFTQAPAAPITAATLTITTLDADVTLTDAGNAVGSLGSVNLGSGGFVFSNNSGATLTLGAITAGDVNITNQGAAIAVTGPIAASVNNVQLTGTSLTQSAVQSVAVSGGAGTFTLTFNGQTTGPIAFNATAAAVQFSLQNLSTVGAGNVTVTGSAGNYSITFTGALALTPLQVAASGSGGASASTTVASITAAGNVGPIADSMTFGAAIKSLNVPGYIFLSPYTSGSAVTVGDSAAPSGLVVNNASLAFLSASFLDVGRTLSNNVTAGAIKVGTANVPTFSLNLDANGTITQDGLVTVRSGTGSLDLNAGGNIDLTGAGASIAVLGGSSLSGSFKVNATSATGTLDIGPIFTGGGDIVVRNTNGNLTVDTSRTVDSTGGNPAAVGNITLSATGAGGLTINGSVVAGAGTVSLTADAIAFNNGSIGTTGTINIAPSTTGTAVRLGDNPSATTGLWLTNNALFALSSASVLNIGKNDGGTTTAGLIDIGNAIVANPTLNLFTSGNVTLASALGMTVGTNGTGTLGVTAGTGVNLTFNSTDGVAVGTVTGSTASGDFLVNGGNGSLAVGAAGITTQGGEIVVASYFGDLAINGALASNGGNILAGSNNFLFGSTSSLTIAADINAGAGGSLGLFAASGGISQTAGKIVAGNLLAVISSATGGITLTSATNSISGNVTLNAGLSGGNISFTNASGYTVGGLSSISYASLGGQSLTTLPAGGSGIRTASTASVTLTAGGDISEGNSLNQDIISTGTLTVARLGSTNPNVILENNNVAANLGAVTLGQGGFGFFNTGDLTITGSATAGGGYFVTAQGTMTVNSSVTIDTSAATSGLALDGTISLETCSCVGGDLTIRGTLNAGTGGIVNVEAASNLIQASGTITGGSVSLIADGGNVSQTGGTITTPTVFAQAFGAVSLNSATNAFGTISGYGATSFSATTTQAMTIGDGAVGSGGDISLTATGASSDITVPTLVFPAVAYILSDGPQGGGNITLTAGRDIVIGSAITTTGTNAVLTLSAVRNITETANGGVVAANLVASATGTITGTAGTVDLTAGSANNNVGTLAGRSLSNFNYADTNNPALTIGTIGSVFGVAATEGNVNISTAGTLTVNSIMSATFPGGDITLTSNGMTIAAAIAADVGLLSLNAGTGAISETGAGRVFGGGLSVTTTNQNVTLGSAANAMLRLGAVTIGKGAFAFVNSVGLTINGVGTAGGGYSVTVNNGAIILNAPANIDTSRATSGAASDGAIAFTTTGGAGNVISLDAALNAGTTGLVALHAAGSVEQFSGPITAGGLDVSTQSDNSFISLVNPQNVFGIITGSLGGSPASGYFSVVNSRSLTIGAAGIQSQSPVNIVVSNNDLLVDGTVTGRDGGGVNAVTLFADRDLLVNAGINAGAGSVALFADRSISDSATGAVVAGRLQIVASGAVDLSRGTGHQVGTLAGSAGTGFAFVSGASLNIGTVGTSVGISTTNGTVTLLSAGDLTIGSSATVTAGLNSAIALSAIGNFINNRGADAVNVSGSGRWLIYSNSPDGDVFNNLVATNTPIYSQTYLTLPPASVTQTGNFFVFASTAPPPNNGGNNPSQFGPNTPPPPPTNTTITFNNNTNTGPINVSFTPPARTADTGINPTTGANPDGAALAGNNGHTYLPISQFDANQYSDFKLPDYAKDAGEAAVFTMLARGADPDHAADAMIDKFWNGTAGAWPTDGALAGKLTFSDGAGNNVAPTGNAGFAITAGQTDFAALLKSGPVMISGGNPVHWLLATQMSADGKSIVANDPATGKQIELAWDPTTKTVGGVTGVFDPATKTFTALANAASGGQGISDLQGFTATNFLAVTVK
jgi:hypothetical protein